jgi:hypothetical protein
MKKGLLIALLLCGATQWQLLHGAPPGDELAEAAADGSGAVAAAPPTPMERLGRLVGEEPEPEGPPTIPMVHCEIDGEGAYLRESECRERGGRVDEPSWASSGP